MILVKTVKEWQTTNDKKILADTEGFKILLKVKYTMFQEDENFSRG